MSEKRGSAILPGIAGGVVGALVTAALLLLAAPQLVGTRIVRQGLLADPQILVETSDKLRDRQYEPALAANRAAIETPFGSSWRGAARPDVVLVEYYDYACPYCKASNPHLERLLNDDKGLRVVYKELPILGEASVIAARMSLAASKAGRFRQFYDAQWAAGRPAPETVAAAAKAAGIPMVLPNDPAIEAELKSNMQVAGQLGATGTPLFIVGNRVLNSAVGYETLRDAIAAARADS